MNEKLSTLWKSFLSVNKYSICYANFNYANTYSILLREEKRLQRREVTEITDSSAKIYNLQLIRR
jgi:hypothetical protein